MLQGLLAAVWAADRKRHPVRSMFSAAPAPQLTFSAGPLPAQPPPLLGYRCAAYVTQLQRWCMCLQTVLDVRQCMYCLRQVLSVLLPAIRHHPSQQLLRQLMQSPSTT